MCGIIAYIDPDSKEDTGKIMLECIKNLEYRGYDSIGMATSEEDIKILKGVGKIGEVDKKLNFSSLNGKIGVAHTRWATNGKVTENNSHPHTSNDGKVCLVHNGIIENHSRLKKEFKIECKTDTDTEIIAQLVSLFMNKEENILDAFKKTLLKLEGSYAIGMIIKGEETLYFARNNSPLVLGIKKDEKCNKYFAASDVPAFISHTKEIMYLDNEEYGTIDDNGINVYDLKSEKKINKDVETVNWDVEQAKKGEYDHFMLKEIYEQSRTIKKAITQNEDNFREFLNILKDAKGIFFVGCGTSYHAAVSASYIFSHIAKKHVNVVLASEFRNYKEFLNNESVVVGISQSGETADLLDAVRAAKSKDSKVISIVNVMGSSLMRESEACLMMNAGPEICVLSTKSYTSQIAILIKLAYSIAQRKEEGDNLVNKAADKINEIIEKNNSIIENIAEKIKNKGSMFLIGRDLAFPSALEGALKIKEVSYIHAEGFAGGELKHGTIALIEEGTPCIVLETKETKDMILSNASEIKARGGHIIGIGEDENDGFDDFIKVDDIDYANPITMIVPIQVLAYKLALKRNCDPDKPRNLAKSVTVR